MKCFLNCIPLREKFPPEDNHFLLRLRRWLVMGEGQKQDPPVWNRYTLHIVYLSLHFRFKTQVICIRERKQGIQWLTTYCTWKWEDEQQISRGLCGPQNRKIKRRICFYVPQKKTKRVTTRPRVIYHEAIMICPHVFGQQYMPVNEAMLLSVGQDWFGLFVCLIVSTLTQIVFVVHGFTPLPST